MLKRGRRGREGPAVTKKIKNNFLAAVLILTGLPAGVKVGEPVVGHFCTQLSEKLAEAGEVCVVLYVDLRRRIKSGRCR